MTNLDEPPVFWGDQHVEPRLRTHDSARFFSSREVKNNPQQLEDVKRVAWQRHVSLFEAKSEDLFVWSPVSACDILIRYIISYNMLYYVD